MLKMLKVEMEWKKVLNVLMTGDLHGIDGIRSFLYSF